MVFLTVASKTVFGIYISSWICQLVKAEKIHFEEIDAMQFSSNAFDLSEENLTMKRAFSVYNASRTEIIY